MNPELRDLFAMQAMQVLLAAAQQDEKEGQMYTDDAIAALAYEMADAMMAARK